MCSVASFISLRNYIKKPTDIDQSVFELLFLNDSL